MEADTISMSAADYAEMFRLRDYLSRMELEETQIAEQHKEAKKRTEAAQFALNHFIDELRRPNLFRDEVGAGTTGSITEALSASAAVSAKMIDLAR